jgi:hypothetical protein
MAARQSATVDALTYPRRTHPEPHCIDLAAHVRPGNIRQLDSGDESGEPRQICRINASTSYCNSDLTWPAGGSGSATSAMVSRSGPLNLSACMVFIR